MDVNLSQQAIENCLKEVHHIGGTTFQNVCDGSSSYVAWGAADWIENIAGTGILVAIAILFIGMIVAAVLFTLKD